MNVSQINKYPLLPRVINRVPHMQNQTLIVRKLPMIRVTFFDMLTGDWAGGNLEMITIRMRNDAMYHSRINNIFNITGPS